MYLVHDKAPMLTPGLKNRSPEKTSPKTNPFSMRPRNSMFFDASGFLFATLDRWCIISDMFISGGALVRSGHTSKLELLVICGAREHMVDKSAPLCVSLSAFKFQQKRREGEMDGGVEQLLKPSSFLKSM